MKTFLKIFTLIILLTGVTVSSQAQGTQKIGYIDFNAVLTQMPGIDSVKIKLQDYQKALTDQMDAMKAEFENKYMDYQSQSATMSDLIKQTKERELTDLQGRIDAFQQKATGDLQTRQQELIAPFIERVKKAVEDVAKENKFTLVINAIEDVVIYKDPADDLLALVKKKLGIQ